MSVKLMGRVFDLAMVSNRKFVLLTLSNYADDDGTNVFPSVETISEKTGIGERTVGRILSEFRENGIISQYDFRKGKRGRIPVYNIDIDRAESVYGFADHNPATVAGSQKTGDVPPADGGESKDAIAAGSQKGNPARVADSQGRLPATGDTTHCHSLADDSSRPVNKKERESPPIAPPTLQPNDLAKAVEDYNVMAKRIGLPVVQNFSDTRQRSLRKRLAECGGLPGWTAALAKVESSSYLKGGGANGWRAGFDFLLQAKSFTRILEGYYDDHARRGGEANPIKAALDRNDPVGKEVQP